MAGRRRHDDLRIDELRDLDRSGEPSEVRFPCPEPPSFLPSLSLLAFLARIGFDPTQVRGTLRHLAAAARNVLGRVPPGREEEASNYFTRRAFLALRIKERSPTETLWTPFLVLGGEPGWLRRQERKRGTAVHLFWKHRSLASEPGFDSPGGPGTVTLPMMDPKYRAPPALLHLAMARLGHGRMSILEGAEAGSGRIGWDLPLRLYRDRGGQGLDGNSYFEVMASAGLQVLPNWRVWGREEDRYMATPPYRTASREWPSGIVTPFGEPRVHVWQALSQGRLFRLPGDEILGEWEEAVYSSAYNLYARCGAVPDPDAFYKHLKRALLEKAGPLDELVGFAAENRTYEGEYRPPMEMAMHAHAKHRVRSPRYPDVLFTRTLEVAEAGAMGPGVVSDFCGQVRRSVARLHSRREGVAGILRDCPDLTKRQFFSEMAKRGYRPGRFNPAKTPYRYRACRV